MLNRENVDNLEHAYLELHFLLEIMKQIVERRIYDYKNSDICCLYSVIIEKRNYFYHYFNNFLNENIQNIHAKISI